MDFGQLASSLWYRRIKWFIYSYNLNPNTDYLAKGEDYRDRERDGTPKDGISLEKNDRGVQ